jgi:hypothetical protein
MTLVALATVVWLVFRRWSLLARAGVASLVGIAFAPSLSVDAVAAPIVLLSLAAMVPDGKAEETLGSR